MILSVETIQVLNGQKITWQGFGNGVQFFHFVFITYLENCICVSVPKEDVLLFPCMTRSERVFVFFCFVLLFVCFCFVCLFVCSFFVFLLRQHVHEPLFHVFDLSVCYSCTGAVEAESIPRFSKVT